MLEHTPAHRLRPNDAITQKATSAAHISQRAAFATKNFGVAAHDNGERFSAGECPKQRTDVGRAASAEANRNIIDRHIVLWYTCKMHHSVRLQDRPVMPRQHVGFLLHRHRFSDQNPTLDLPRTTSASSESHCGFEES